MNLESHIAVLKGRHAQFEAQIGEESRRPAPNPDRIIRLKLEKLRLKEELSRLTEPRP